jgi:hypothetical protein
MSGNIGGEALGEARLHAQCEATIRGLEAENRELRRVLRWMASAADRDVALKWKVEVDRLLKAPR